jgi:hypothetical protein
MKRIERFLRWWFKLVKYRVRIRKYGNSKGIRGLH